MEIKISSSLKFFTTLPNRIKTAVPHSSTPGRKLIFSRIQIQLQKVSLVLKVTLGVGSILALAVALSAILSFNYSEKLLLQATSEDMVKSLRWQKENLETVLDEVKRDTELICHGPAVQGLIRAELNLEQDPPTEDWQKHLERTFSVLIESKGYKQVRFIGLLNGGRELVRVDAPSSPGAAPRIIRAPNLQQKGHRGYVQEGFKLKHGQTFISSITLNREQGIIQEPWQPTQRFVAPVYLDSESENHGVSHNPGSELVGLVVINTSAECLMQQLDAGNHFNLTMINKQGGILYHKDQSLCWQFEFNPDAGLPTQDPHAWEIFVEETEMTSINDQDRHVHAAARVQLGDGQDSYLGLIMSATSEQLLAASKQLKKRTAIMGSLSFLVAFLLALQVVKRLIKPIVLLTDQADQLVAGERTAIEVSHGLDEVGHLGRTFEKLIGSLEEKVTDRTEKLVGIQIKLQRDAMIIKAMNDALALSLYSTSSEELLTGALDLLLGLDFLAIEDQGAAFIVEEDPPVLVLTAHRNLSRPLHQMCAKVPFGHCLCGRAAEQQKILFKKSWDSDHHNNYPEMPPHGHYNVPLLDGPGVVGMLALYVPPDAERHDDDVKFLMAFSDILAGAIRRLKTEKDLHNSLETTETALFELESVRKEAVAANESKSAFLANMSHEIRTPMTAILGYTDLLAEGDISVDEGREYLNTIKQNGSHLLTIINDILDISKIEAGKMEIEILPISLWNTVSDVQDLLAGRAKEKGILLHSDFKYPLPKTINSDPVRLRQVLLNLVGNSIKFTNKGEVRISTSLVNGKIRLAISDTGIGMSPQQAQRLFQPFNQADVSTTRQFGGTGLGLAISKRLTEMMDGEIILESEAGLGSTFTVEIDPGDLTSIAMVNERPLKTAPEDDLSDQPDGGSGGIARILLAEDTLVNQKLAVRLLTKAGHKVDTANNGLEAMEMALGQWHGGTPYDVILMDMQMPIIDGYEATIKLRETGYALPIVALTANAMASDREKCIQAGCDDFATKPFQKKKLLQIISRWLRQVQLID